MRQWLRTMLRHFLMAVFYRYSGVQLPEPIAEPHLVCVFFPVPFSVSLLSALYYLISVLLFNLNECQQCLWGEDRQESRCLIFFWQSLTNCTTLYQYCLDTLTVLFLLMEGKMRWFAETKLRWQLVVCFLNWGRHLFSDFMKSIHNTLRNDVVSVRCTEWLDSKCLTVSLFYGFVTVIDNMP